MLNGAGPEFGSKGGRTSLLFRPFAYDLNSASFRVWSSLAEKLASMNSQSSMADPDVQMRAAAKGDGKQWFERHDVCWQHLGNLTCNTILEEVQGTFKLIKNDKINVPEIYLGAELQRHEINGITCWTVTSQDYLKAAMINVEEAIKNTRQRLLRMASIDTPMQNMYSPETRVTHELNVEDLAFYQELNSILRWATESGWVDILSDVALL